MRSGTLKTGFPETLALLFPFLAKNEKRVRKVENK
jgi:hypothetical protein